MPALMEAPSTEFILNGQASGTVGQRLMQAKWNPDVLRTWLGKDGYSYMNVVNAKGEAECVRLANNNATLTKDAWIQLDEAIIKIAKPRLRIVNDLRGAGLVYNIPGGMAKITLEYQDQSDITPATISMDGLADGESDRPEFGLKSMPLPIVSKDFQFSLRQLEASRNSGAPLDTTMAELAARQVAEYVEKLTIGELSYYYGGGYVYGLRNFNLRNTKVLTAPTTSNGNVIVNEILAMMQQSRDDNFYGPWMLYNSPAYDQYLDGDYNTAGTGFLTLRERIKKIPGIVDMRTADYLTGSRLVLVQMTSDVIRMVVGMDMMTLHWPTHGGLMENFKVMCILVPQCRADQDGKCGIVEGAVP